MSNIRLHHVPFSRSFRILWLLEELGLDCETSLYSIRDGSLRTPEFLAISPGGRVPALEIDGIVIFESPAIVEYLCETWPAAGLGRLAGEAERIDFLQWISFAETQASTIATLNLQMVFLRPPATPSPVVLKLEVARLRASLKTLDRALEGRDWLLKGGFSAADIMMGFNLFAAKYYVDLAPMTNLTAYMDRIEARPAYQRARARDGVQEFYDKDFYPVPEEG
jgi:glutathione S-transferase